jgi:hypothetical protein
MFPGGKGGRCVGLTTLPPPCADCLEIWEPEPLGTLGFLQACNVIALPVARSFPPVSLLCGSTLICGQCSSVGIETGQSGDRIPVEE